MGRLAGWLEAGFALARRRGTKDVGWSLAGTAFQTAAGVVTTVLLARTLGPTGFGLLSVIMALVFVVSGLADIGFTASIIRLGSPEIMQGRDIRHLHTVFLLLRVAASAALGVVVTLAGHWLLPALQLPPRFAWLAGVAAAAGVAMAVGSHFVTILQVARHQRGIAMVRSGASALRLLAYGTLALARGLSLSSAILVALLAIPLEMALAALAAHRTLPLWPPVLRLPPHDWLALSAWAAVPAMVGPLIGQTDTLLLAGMSSAAETGLWNAAARIAGMVTLASGALFAVAFPYATGVTERGALERYLRLAGLAWAGLGAVCGAGIIVAPWVTALFFGGAYAAAVPVLRWLLAANGLAVGVLLLAPVAYRLGRERLVAGMAATQAVVNLGGDILLIPRFGAEGCAAATLFMYATSLALLLPLGRPRALTHMDAPQAAGGPSSAAGKNS